MKVSRNIVYKSVIITQGDKKFRGIQKNLIYVTVQSFSVSNSWIRTPLATKGKSLIHRI